MDVFKVLRKEIEDQALMDHLSTVPEDHWEYWSPRLIEKILEENTHQIAVIDEHIAYLGSVLDTKIGDLAYLENELETLIHIIENRRKTGMEVTGMEYILLRGKKRTVKRAQEEIKKLRFKIALFQKRKEELKRTLDVDVFEVFKASA